MGIFDDIRKAIGGAAPPSQPSRAPTPPPSRPGAPAASSAAAQSLKAAQDARRGQPMKRLKTGKPLSAYRLKQYERLERSVVMQTGAFPLDAARVRHALAAKGFRAEDVEAYLRSDAARKLLS